MNYFVHGATLALAWFLAINVLVSAAVVLAAIRPPRLASSLLALRLLPAMLSTAFVAIVFLPSYWTFEPRDFPEGFDLTLTALAGLAVIVLVGTASRTAGVWWRAVRRARVWTQTAAPLALAGIEVPAFRIDAPEPVMALVGIFRTRLIVTRGLIEALTPEEIAAGAAHEAAHDRARDNLTRLAMRGAPDVLHWTRAARVLERRWAAAAEHRADAAASIVGSRAARLALASALVKIARLMPAAAPLGEPISTLVGGGEIAARVERLIDDGPHRGANRRRPGALWTVLAIAAAAALAAGYLPLLETIHRTTEILVQRLP